MELELGQAKLARSVTALAGAGYDELVAQDGAESQQAGGLSRPAALDPTHWAAALAASNAALPPTGPLPDGSSMLRLAAWVALLWAGYGLQRGLCAAGIPSDCDTPDAAGVFSTLTLLAFLGGGLAWLAGVTQPGRFAWLFGWRRAYLWLGYAALFPAYGAVSNIPALQQSLASTASWGTAMIAAAAAVGAIVVAALAFHIWLAIQAGCAVQRGIADDGSSGSDSSSGSSSSGGGSSVQGDAEAPVSEPGSPEWVIGSTTGGGRASALQLMPPGASAAAEHVKGSGSSSGGCSRGAGSRVCGRGSRRARWRALGLYLLPRLGVLAWLGVWCGVLPAAGGFSVHLHHYVLGWVAACFAAFNHPVSGLLLALGTAVFVQGAAVYGFDPLFTPDRRGGCLPASSNATGQMVCAFWGAQPFNLSFCTDQPTIPWFDCSVPWPWPETALAAGWGGAARA